ncbi:MAG TPA: DUF4157 domain-containing protein [Thermoanaerobaculia bacterium]|nr:DUF4157 domain-containing protein [Thermoanaerobaculia bacterium]
MFARMRPPQVPAPGVSSPGATPQLALGPPAGVHERAAEQAAEQVVDRLHAGPERTDGLHGSRERPDGPRLPEPRTAAAPPRQAAAPAAATPVVPEVATAIHQQAGEGAPLPAAIRRSMEGAYGVSFAGVRVHADQRSAELNKALGAAAFATGRDVFFRQGGFDPQSRKGQTLIAHELAHVVQQGAAPPQPAAAAGPDLAPDWKGSDAASLHPLLPSSSLSVAPGSLIQRQFAGPKFGLANYHNGNYPGHSLTFPGGARPNTACGVRNLIRTAGEQYDAGAISAPGDPTNFPDYRDGYSRAGGLVKDTNLHQASTRMHLINHHFDPANGAAGTQQNPTNILLGSKRSNGAHCNQVEKPVKNAVVNHGTQKNAGYETAMNKAIQTHATANPATKMLFWTPANKPPNAAVKHAKLAQNVWLQNNNPAQGVDPVNHNVGTDVQGDALEVVAATPGNNYRHLWVEYEVVANYGVRPADVTANIVHENLKNNPFNAALAAKITNFDNNWSKDAFPPDFDCKVDYYSATYDPWNGIYQVEGETQNILTDL